MNQANVDKFFEKMLGNYFPWILYTLALLTTFYLTLLEKPFLESYLQAVVFFMGGVQGFWAGAAHLFFENATAKQIGWISNGFQTEMGFTNIALGTAGLISWHHPGWLAPVGLILAIIFSGCAFLHIKDRIIHRKSISNDNDPILYSTILTSASLFTALLMLLFQE